MKRVSLLGACVIAALSFAACDDEKDVQDQAYCMEGTYVCQMNTLMRCSQNRWQIFKTCTTTQVCSEAAASCVDNGVLPPDPGTPTGCMTGSRQCSADLSAVEYCMDGKWYTEMPCLYGTQCNGTGMACEAPKQNEEITPTICKDNTRMCDADGSRVLACANGVWIAMKTCNTASHEFCDADTLDCKQGCSEGAQKCNAEADAIMVCSNNAWSVQSNCLADEVCNDTSKSCQKKIECVNGESYCNGDQIVVCQNNKWTNGTVCESDSTCFDGACVKTAPACTEGVSECLSDSELSVCAGGKITTSACGNGQKCFTRNGKSQCEAVVCTENSCKDDSTRYICNTALNSQTEESCPASTVCDSETKSCIPRTCTEKEKRCANNNVEVCTNNAWTVQTSCSDTQMCKESTKQCVKIVCTDGDTRCNSKGKLETCSNNKFGSATACGNGKVCQAVSEKKSECVDLVCTNGMYQCVGAELQKCVDNAWVKQTTCDSPALCTAKSTSGSCKARECENGAEACSNSKASSKLCKDYVWELTLCSTVQQGSKCSMSNGHASCQLPVCTNGYSCDGNTLKRCENNAYTYTKDCGNSATCDASAGKCVANECAEGNYSCASSTLRKCENGKWVSKATCTANQQCSAENKKCVDNECKADEFKCDGKALYDCVNGKWHLVETCTASQTCDASAGICQNAAVCGYGNKCENNNLYKCLNGAWVLQKECAQGETCSSSAGLCAQCGGNSYECRGQDLYNCRDYVWVKQQTCAANETCSGSYYGGGCIANEVPECTNGQKKCDGNTLKSCSNGKWSVEKECGAGESCNWSAGVCAECSGNFWQCKGQDLYNCQNYKWVKDRTCTANQTCYSHYYSGGCTDNNPAECTDNQYKCDGNTLQICTDGKWKTSKACTNNQTCSANGNSGACIDNLSLPEWCQIFYLNDEKYDRGYGRVLIPQDVSEEQISAEFVCGNLATPVAEWYSATATKNEHCGDCGNNTEYISGGLNAPGGSYNCAYRFNFGLQSVLCKKGGGAPVVMTPTTKLTAEDTMPITINSVASAEKPSWCWFKHLSNDQGNYGEAYLHVYPGTLNGGQITAELICGSASTPVTKWSLISRAVENVFCGQPCGNNLEFMTKPQNAEIPGSQKCAFRIRYDTAYYICPIADSNGNNMLQVTMETGTLSSDYYRP